MPKLGAEPIRKAALINATISELGKSGSLDVTVAQIARAAGMSAGLAHHYFGSKEQMFLATMRHILSSYGARLREKLPGTGPRGRLDAILEASFEDEHFRQDVISAWLNFYALALINPEAKRLLRIYHRRLHSNLVVALTGLCADPRATAHTLGALIDGVYLRAVLEEGPTDGHAAVVTIRALTDDLLG